MKPEQPCQLKYKIKQTISKFHRQLVENPNHRYRSWEHCYSYFNMKDVDTDTACLHLAFYLASWGMYRGSTFLLWKDYKVHEGVVDIVLEHKEKFHNLDFYSIDDSILEEIVHLAEKIRKCYKETIINVNPTDTLLTKIMLGTLGCTPAYDRFVVNGMRASKIKYSEHNLMKNLKRIVECYKTHHEIFGEVQTNMLNENSITYPPMKLVDMYFWQIGYDLSKK